VSPTNFGTIRFISFRFQNPIAAVLEAMFFTADLITNAATPPD
jgi:hypothetical protein